MLHAATICKPPLTAVRLMHTCKTRRVCCTVGIAWPQDRDRQTELAMCTLANQLPITHMRYQSVPKLSTVSSMPALDFIVEVRCECRDVLHIISRGDYGCLSQNTTNRTTLDSHDAQSHNSLCQLLPDRAVSQEIDIFRLACFIP